MKNHSENPGSQLERLKDITRTLRAPGGCEWDRAQDYRSMRRYVLEETYELIHAIEQDDFENLVEELGDLLFHVLFFAQMGSEEGRFDLEDIAREIGDKLVRRHPHVFGDVQVDGVGEILKNWDEIKAQEKRDKGNHGVQAGSADEAAASAGPGRESAIPGGTGRELPALMRAEKIQKKASKVGFDWRLNSGSESDADASSAALSQSNAGAAGRTIVPEGVIQKVHEELEELAVELANLSEAGHGIVDAPAAARERLEDEIGDVFFSVVNLARHLKVEPESSVNRANEKFLRRFHSMEALAASQGLDFATLDETQLDALWEQAKAGRDLQERR